MPSTLPTGVRALLGLAAIALEEVRKIPETLPTVAATVPVGAISTAMQASLKFQQQVAVLASRGDEVISQFRGSHEDPPAWATFDDDGPRDADGAQDAEARPLAAFERVAYQPPSDDLRTEPPLAKKAAKKAPAKKAAAAKKAPGTATPAKTKAAPRKKSSLSVPAAGPAVASPSSGPAVPSPAVGPATPAGADGE